MKLSNAEDREFLNFVLNKGWKPNGLVQRILSRSRLYNLDKKEMKVLEDAFKIIIIQEEYLEFKYGKKKKWWSFK